MDGVRTTASDWMSGEPEAVALNRKMALVALYVEKKKGGGEAEKGTIWDMVEKENL